MPSPPVLALEQANATGRVTFWQDKDNHSVADRNGVSLAEYIHALYGLLRQAGARDVLMIGGGGGTLATMLSRVGVKVTMVDVDARAFEVARRYFALPARVTCHVGDGAAFLREQRSRHDAIVLDAFAGGVIPRHLAGHGFLALVKTRLKARGLFLVNVVAVNDADKAPDRLARRMSALWRGVRLLDTQGWDDRNTILLAGAVGGLKPPRLRMRPRSCARSIAAALGRLAFRTPRP